MKSLQTPSFSPPAHLGRNTASQGQRFAGIAFVAAVHALLLYALLNALNVVPMPKIPGVIGGRVIFVPPEANVPLPPPPLVAPPPVVVPPTIVDIPVEMVAPPASTAITATPPQVASLPVPRAPAPPVRAPARAIAATHTTPDYPPVSRRLAEQGTLRLKLSIDEQGAVRDAMLITSSGFARLDMAAVDWVKAHWRYQPATEGGHPVPSYAEAVVTFRLR